VKEIVRGMGAKAEHWTTCGSPICIACLPFRGLYRVCKELFRRLNRRSCTLPPDVPLRTVLAERMDEGSRRGKAGHQTRCDSSMLYQYLAATWNFSFRFEESVGRQ
jgi:hypothetical protein